MLCNCFTLILMQFLLISTNIDIIDFCYKNVHVHIYVHAYCYFFGLMNISYNVSKYEFYVQLLSFSIFNTFIYIKLKNNLSPF